MKEYTYLEMVEALSKDQTLRFVGATYQGKIAEIYVKNQSNGMWVIKWDNDDTLGVTAYTFNQKYTLKPLTNEQLLGEIEEAFNNTDLTNEEAILKIVELLKDNGKI